MAGDHSPAWCTREVHHPDPRLHMAEPVEINTETDRILLHLMADNGRPAFLSVQHWYVRTDPTDEPAGVEPDGVLVLKLGAAAELAGVLAALVAAGLGGAR